MTIDTTYEKISTEFPEAISKIEKQKKKSKAKDSKEPLKDFTFFFSIAEKVEGCSAQDPFNGKGIQKQIEERKLGVEKRLAKRLPNLMVSIKAKLGRCYLYTNLDTVPSTIIDAYRTMIQEEVTEETRIDNLTDEQREQELEECLKGLRGPGFAEFRIKGN